MRTLLPALWLAVACQGSDDKQDADGDSLTDPTLKVGPDFIPHAVGVRGARFSVDAAGRVQGPRSWDGSGWVDEPITVTVTLVDDSIDAAAAFPDDSNSCSVTFVMDGPLTQADWVGDTSAWFAFEVPEDAARSSDCDRWTFPDEWGDPEGIVASWRWGVGVGQVAPATLSFLEASYGSEVFDVLEPYIAGAGYFWSELLDAAVEDSDDWEGGWVHTGVTYAYVVDDQLQQQVNPDGSDQLERAVDLSTGDSVIPALYDLEGTTFLTGVRP